MSSTPWQSWVTRRKKNVFFWVVLVADCWSLTDAVTRQFLERCRFVCIPQSHKKRKWTMIIFKVKDLADHKFKKLWVEFLPWGDHFSCTVYVTTCYWPNQSQGGCIYIHVTNFIFSNYQQLSENIFKPVGEHTLLSSDWLYFTWVI